MPRIPVVDRTKPPPDEDGPDMEAATNFTESLFGVAQSLEEGDCQAAAEFFSDAGDWYADIIRYAEEGYYSKKLLALWEQRYKEAYAKLHKECEVVIEDLNGPRRR